MSYHEKEDHPAVDRIRATLELESFTSGTCCVNKNSLSLYYRSNQTDKKADVLNLAHATPDELESLISAFAALPSGRGSQAGKDESYHKPLELDVAQFSIPFDLSETGILNKIQHDLVDTRDTLRSSIRTELCKLEIYDKGSLSKAQEVTPTDTTMFGSLVIILPIMHEGGNLLLFEGVEQWDFDAPSILQKSTPDAPSIAWVAFHSNVSHEVLPITSGVRVTLTFNLYLKDIDNAKETILSSDANMKFAALTDSLEELVDAHDDEHLFAFGLAHLYPIVKDQAGYRIQELKQHLKGNDALVFAACRELGLDVSVKVWYPEYEDSGYLSAEVCKVPSGSELLERPVLYERMYRIDEDVPTTWVTPDTRNTTARTQYVDYEHSNVVSGLYGSVCIIACRRLPASAWRRNRQDFYRY
ncbi:hypothetical protein CYLTODRAFT_404326 [Cylindrobasidium torrendii FP15055 ss-10]|uniref:Prolyl 4-hydroxylase alpha subunit Fe(2+) 2OG dioxygenase domain-containing protein n=1 Tax=Cylindrobasidium torrendii FP15055 ss-10 TaxID=1314674 RepID=A0A0D7AX80_9AGAR|nr:hypothetical protein CYLTODRAFT_404326 [Cylindrobasidium torrendii FP15055 ss-10]